MLDVRLMTGRKAAGGGASTAGVATGTTGFLKTDPESYSAANRNPSICVYGQQVSTLRDGAYLYLPTTDGDQIAELERLTVRNANRDAVEAASAQSQRESSQLYSLPVSMDLSVTLRPIWTSTPSDSKDVLFLLFRAR